MQIFPAVVISIVFCTLFFIRGIDQTAKDMRIVGGNIDKAISSEVLYVDDHITLPENEYKPEDEYREHLRKEENRYMDYMNYLRTQRI